MSLRTVRATVALGVLALLLVLAGGWLVLVGPATGALGTTREELADTTDANLLLTSRLTRLETQRDDLGAVEAIADELATVAPPTADQPGFFALIDAAAREAGIRPAQVTTLSPTAPVAVLPATTDGTAAAPPDDGAAADPAATAAEATLAVQSVTVAVEAGYEQVRRLLAALETMERGFLVQSVALSGGSGEGAAGDLVVTITGATFLAPPVPAPDDTGVDTGVDTGADAEASAEGLGG